MIGKIYNLVQQMNKYRDHYYNKNISIIENEEYDRLFDELQQMEKESGYILSNSPTQQVGFTVLSKLKKVKHTTKLLSLNKTKSIVELHEYLGDHLYTIMSKADGLTIELKYDNGELIQGSTRGDGEIGEDVTHSCRVFKNLPLTIPFKGKLTIAGEAIIHKNDFEQINEKLPDDEKYKHPRNLCAGSVRQLSSKICSERMVNFYAFSVLECSDPLPDSREMRLHWLCHLGFTAIHFTSKQNISVEELTTIIDDFKFASSSFFLPIDGLVFSFDSINYGESLGVTSHHPLHSLALKFEDEIARSILRDIEISTGKENSTPVAIFDPVLIDGSSITRAVLFNLSYIKKLELGIGDEIGIIKANMIIPQVVENYTRSNTYILPTKCPDCGSKLLISQEFDSEVLYCDNPNCKGKIIRKLMHYASRDAMNIVGVSKSVISKLYDENLLTKFSDFHSLKNFQTRIVNLEGMGIGSYFNMINSIEKSTSTDMYRIIYAQCIPNIGISASKSIAKYFNYDIYNFITALNTKFDFSDINDFGAITNQSIHDWWRDNQNSFKELLKHININEQDTSTLKTDLIGLTFCVTGEFENYKPRKKLESLIESMGGKLASSISHKTSYLITNDSSSGSKKAKTAKELLIPILSESEFNAKFLDNTET